MSTKKTPRSSAVERVERLHVTMALAKEHFEGLPEASKTAAIRSLRRADEEAQIVIDWATQGCRPAG